MADDRASISAIVLDAMGDAWTDSEEHSALPGVAADMLLTSDWLAAHDKQVRAEAATAATITVDDPDAALSFIQTSLAEARAEGERAAAERIATELEVHMRRHDGAQIGFSAVGDAYAHAARIARGEAGS